MLESNEIKKIEDLYKLYGFEESENRKSSIIFTYSYGYFDNAEIVHFDRTDESGEKLKKEYEDLGFSVRELDYKSFDSLHDFLFKGFFGIEKIKNKLLKDYSNFISLQTKKLFDSEYEYVEPTYFWNNEIRKNNLVKEIMEQLNKKGAQLIILEAAAGYGKTCTSYELIKGMAKDNGQYAPIFTELSKNRKAAIFRYVLLDEIDRKFTSLSSQLVISEIQNGKVPLIIDGFDELISRSNPNMDTEGYCNEDDESQTMLDTIADLFQEQCSTKVVLTSRKSAIFTGDIFQQWVEKRLVNCEVTRISIEEPTIQDWLGYDKVHFLENQRIPFVSIVNPILLAFMRSMSMETFKTKCENVEQVISYYFESLLTREKERQSLSMTVEEQYATMKLLAKEFVEFDIVSEELSFIKELFQENIHDKFNEYKERYLLVEERPTEEEFATKLAGHALLNRISPTKNQVGFINDFIFGMFIGDAMIEKKLNLSDVQVNFFDIACTAYASRSIDNRQRLLDAIYPYLKKFNYEQQLDIELKLASTIQQDYKEHYISNRTFNTDIYFDGNYKFINCTFRNCVFQECYIMTSAFQECSFYDCKFYDISVLRDTYENCRLIFSSNCSGHENFLEEASYEIPVVVEDNYEKAILKKYWNTGKRYIRGSLPEKVLLSTSDAEERKGLENALESLKKQDLLYKDGHSWVSNRTKIKEIKEILEM
jgi:hypothetical protein